MPISTNYDNPSPSKTSQIHPSTKQKMCETLLISSFNIGNPKNCSIDAIKKTVPFQMIIIDMIFAMHIQCVSPKANTTLLHGYQVSGQFWATSQIVKTQR